ncbi:MAG TPA: NAD(P)/FAD-dependent oxidoreductase, partial [Solirubrobacteraceae bacterium]|nr:NAD(P)/FAD-dependent oxidoreductase [Solirubrobacteraceae bacterium]
SPVFRELELDLDWVNPAIPMVHVTDEEGGEVTLHRDLAETAASLERCARGAGVAWQELVGTLWPRREALIATILSPLPPIRASVRLLAGLRSKALELAPIALGSSASLGTRLFGDRRAAAWLAGSGAHADLSPLAPGSAPFALGLNFLGHHVGWPFPRGGAGRLTDALVSRLLELGGQLRCGSRVRRIELAHGRVSALRLPGDERIDIDAVVATCSPRPLLDLLPAGALPTRVERRLAGWRYGMGTAKLDCALSGPIPWRSVSARAAAVVHVGGPLEETVRSLTEAGLGRLPERPALVVGQHSLHDPARAPEGKHTLYAYARVPYRLEPTDEELAERLEQQIERFAPGFRSLIEATSLRSPASIEAENPSLGNGDLASGSCELDQQLLFRPDPRLCRGRTPIQGLYAAGAWVHPGPGVHGVSGRSAARTALRDLRRRLR